MAQITLFAAPAHAELARRITVSDQIDLGAIDWKSFADGWPNTFVRDVHSTVRDKHVVFITDFQTPADIFIQLAVIMAMPAYNARSLTIIVPFFSTGTMNRIINEGEIATAKTLARMLSGIPHSYGNGPARIVIYDIHALQERFYFSDNVTVRLETALPLLAHEIAQLNNVAICYPDDGAYKRFHQEIARLCPRCRYVICSKQRESDRRFVTVKEGAEHVPGSHCVIVDDLVQTGGTLEECRKVLVAAGAAAVSAYVTHGVFPGESWRKFLLLPDRDTFANFWLTDSCPAIAGELRDQLPFRILSLDQAITALITEGASR